MVALSLPRLEGSRRTRFIIGAAFGSVIILFILAWSHQLLDPTAAGLSAVASIPWSIFVVNTQPPYYGREAKWVKRTVGPPANCTEATEGYFFCRNQQIDELVAQPSPTTFGCPKFSLAGSNPLVFIGVMSNSNGGPAEARKREVWRALSEAGVAPEHRHLVDIRFVLGRPTRSTDPEVAQAALTAEHARFGDLFQLDGLTDGDNGDGGKTYSMFRAIYDESKDAPERRPIFVMKTDIDSLLVLPNILTDLHAFSGICHAESAAAYWGTGWGSWIEPGVPFYFRGLGYILSWPLVAWLGSTTAPLPVNQTKDAEDVRTGHFLQSLLVGTALWVKDEHFDAQDWDSGEIPRNGELTVSLVHKLKSESKYIEQAAVVRSSWDAAGVDYLWRPLTAEQLAAGHLLAPVSVPADPLRLARS